MRIIIIEGASVSVLSQIMKRLESDKGLLMVPKKEDDVVGLSVEEGKKLDDILSNVHAGKSTGILGEEQQTVRELVEDYLRVNPDKSVEELIAHVGWNRKDMATSQVRKNVRVVLKDRKKKQLSLPIG